MYTDLTPILPEAVPPGWGPVTTREDTFVYRYRRHSLDLEADRVPAHSVHPGLGRSHCWEIRCVHPVPDRSVHIVVGHVSNRRAAIAGLRDCMRSIHGRLDGPTTPQAIETALRAVSLSDRIDAR